MGYKEYDMNEDVRYEDPDTIFMKDFVQDLHYPKQNKNICHEPPLHN